MAHPADHRSRPADREAAAARLRTALDLFSFGRAMKLQQLRREHPDANDEELRARLLRWLARDDEDPGPGLVKRRGRRVP